MNIKKRKQKKKKNRKNSNNDKSDEIVLIIEYFLQQNTKEILPQKNRDIFLFFTVLFQRQTSMHL